MENTDNLKFEEYLPEISGRSHLRSPNDLPQSSLHGVDSPGPPGPLVLVWKASPQLVPSFCHGAAASSLLVVGHESIGWRVMSKKELTIFLLQ